MILIVSFLTSTMPRKKKADIKHPGKSHPTLTAEVARERERQRQRDRRAQQRLERAADPVAEAIKEPDGKVAVVTSTSRN